MVRGAGFATSFFRRLRLRKKLAKKDKGLMRQTELVRGAGFEPADRSGPGPKPGAIGLAMRPPHDGVRPARLLSAANWPGNVS